MQCRLSVLASALLLAFPFQLAQAQAALGPPLQTQQQSEPQPEQDANQEMTTVTVAGFRAKTVQVGTFRDMSPLDVPQTSNVINRDVLDAQAATTLYGALRNSAGVTRSQLSGSTYDNIAIRGILVENRGNYRLNGSLPIINLVDVPLENKDRVEVLKGASSLYYGFVPPSGIVNLVTKRAGRDPVSTVTLSASEHGAASVHTDLARRFGDQQQFGVRLNLVEGREDIGIDNYSGSRGLFSAALDWKATRDLSFKFDFEHYRKSTSEQAAIAVPAAVNGKITLPAVPDATRNLAGEWQKYDAEATNVLLRGDYKLSDNWMLLVEAGKAHTERDRNFSQFQNYDLATGDGMLRIFFNRGQQWNNVNYRTELAGRFSGTWITHELALGYTANQRSQDARTSTFVDVAQNLYQPVTIAPMSSNAALGNAPSTIRDRGWYLSDRVLIGEQWQAMVGVRGSRYESETATTRYSADQLSPSLSLMYQPVSNLSLYASYIKGAEESGQAPSNRANSGELLPPAVSTQKEIGIKAEVAQGVLLQAAYFDIRRPSTTIDAGNRLVLNGLAQYRGIELAASGEVTRQLSLIGSMLFLDAQQLNAANAATFGKTPDNTPQRTASLFAEYRLADAPAWALSGGVYFVGKRPVNNANMAFVDSYATLSLGARHTTRVGGKRVVIQAVVDNATNSNYWSTAGNGLLGVGAPRTVKMTARVEF